jgi:uncharacterized membrane protein
VIDDMKRISSIDVVRGVVMVIMALDHVRDLLHVNSATQSPTDLATTTPLLFFTRWITHLCAPTFVFLAGTSAFLVYQRKGAAVTRTFLLTRGLGLILLEFTVVNFALFFDIGFHTVMFEVIATIGFGFVVLSFMMKVPVRIMAGCGLLILFCHELFPLIPFGTDSVATLILGPFFNPGAFALSPGRFFVVAYPPFPWLGIMLTGFAAGKLFEFPAERRKKIFALTGAGALLLFGVLRFVNVYGDPAPWGVQRDWVYTILSFMNVTKYPPSLLFCLVTLGIMFLMLALAERATASVTVITSVYGKVPLFYFVVHFYLIHTILLMVLLWQGFSWGDLTFASGSFGRPPDVPSGISLAGIYGVWIGVVLILYRPCQWFGKYKTGKPNSWLRYV